MEEDDGNPRGKELTANSEEELLAMQEEFMAQHRRPAADVTRISRRNGSGAPPESSTGSLGAAATRRASPAQPLTASHLPSAGVAAPRAPRPALGGGGGGFGGPEGSVRGDEELRARTEEELLQMQEEFLAQNSRPAARVTRITRRAPAAAAAAAQPTPAADDAVAVAATEAAAPAVGSGNQAGASRGGTSAGAAATAASAAPPKPQAKERLAPDAAAGGRASGAAVPRQRQREAPAPEPKSILAPIEGLLGDIVERPSPALPPQAPPAGPVVVREVVAPIAFPSVEGAGGEAAGVGGGVAAAASFPEALHRRQSKFALSRKSKQLQQQPQPQAAIAGAGSSAPTAPSGAAAGVTTAGHPVNRSTLTDWSVLPTGPVSAAATAADQDARQGGSAAAGAEGAGGGAAGGGSELGVIGDRNLEAVSRMRPEEVAAALQELSSRMSPEAMDFLRRRGAQRLALQRQQPQPQPQQQDRAPPPQPPPPSARLAGGLAARPRLGPAAELASCTTQEDGNAVIDSALRALTDTGGAAAAAVASRGAALPASVAAPGNPLGSLPIGALAAAQQRQQAQSGGSGAGAAAMTAPGQGQAQDQGGAQGQGQGPTRGSPADPRLVARLRFDVDGSVVGVQGPEEVFVEEEVLLRDQLRRDEGSAPPGYTLSELLVLCRSAVAAQRAAGLAAIADLAATARPRAEDLQMCRANPGEAEGANEVEAAWAPGQMLRRFVPIPEHLRDRAPACSVSWQEVWQFFVSELGLVAHLRLALDDDRPGVLAAAATALAVVLGRSESELLAAEMADTCPSTGWPSAAGGYLTRHGVAAPWEAAPPVAAAAAAAPPSQAAPGADDDPDAPEDVALVDPLAGALQMGLLQRVRYLLTSRQSPGAALPLLAVLCGAARGGGEAAAAVAREPGLLEAVGALLDPAAAAAAATAPAAGEGGTAAAEGGGTASASAASAGESAVQVAALMLVRLLCGSSSVVAHLVRSAGLLAHTQAFLLLAGTADGGGGGGDGDGGGGGSSFALQLLRLEALRIWRVCAHHGISLASLDDLYGNLCHLLLPPLAASPPLAATAAATDAAATTAVRQLTTAELYLLLATLVRHSFAVAGGDATIGRSMLGPGAAAVIAAEAAAWLRPAALAGVAAAAVTRCNLTVPLLATTTSTSGGGAGGGPSGGLLRVLLGAHPAVLLPPAATHVACLAAVAAFLGTYWATAGAAQPVFADVRGALAASGLLLPPDAAAPEAAATLPVMAMSPTDALAVALLRAPRNPVEAVGEGKGAAGASCRGSPPPPPQGDDGPRASGSPVGRALAEWALAAVGGACVAAPTAEGAADGLRLGALAQACLQVSAAALLYGILQLAAAVHRDAAGSGSPPAAAAGPLAAAVLAATAPLCCQAGAAAPVAVGRVLCPWHAAALQRQLHLTRLLLLAATLLPPDFYEPAHDDDGDGCNNGACGGDAGSGSGGVQDSGGVVEARGVRSARQEERQRLQTCVLEGCLAALSASPPGAEGLCLQLLRLALRGGLLEQPVRAAHAAAAELAAAVASTGSGPDAKLAAAASGLPYTSVAAAAGNGSADAPFPLPAAPPPAADVADVLFESYAASWLSLISQRRLAAARAGAPGGAATGTAVAPCAAAAPPLPRLDPLELAPVSLQGQRGSRLPAPGQWSLLEAHRLPHQLQKHQGAEAEAAAAVGAALHPVGCALVLCLGRETCAGAGCGSRGGGGGAGALRWLPDAAKAQAALKAAYLFRAEEMVPRDADEASEGSWRDPWVRWSLAGLARRYLFSRDGLQARPPGPPGPEWLPPALAEQLIAALGSSCFGDPLLAAHLALALATDASPVVRLQVWNGLAMDKSLHLLPPLSRCLGGSAQYLGPPPLPPATAGGAAASPSSSTAEPHQRADASREPDPDPAFLAAVQRSLIEGDLDRALLPPAAAAAAAAPADAAPDGAAAPETALAAGAAAAAAGCASLAGDVALQQLASHLLRRERWPALERAWKRTEPGAAPAQPEAGDGGSGGAGGAGRPGASPGAAMLGALVRGARPELVAAVVLVAERRCGLRREEAAAVLAQTCAGGDAALRERARHVLALCGLL